MTYEEHAILWDELIDAREELLRIKHVSQEVLDGLSAIANLSEPHINRLRAQMRHKDDREVFDFILQCYKQVQQRAALIVEGIGDEHQIPVPSSSENKHNS